METVENTEKELLIARFNGVSLFATEEAIFEIIETAFIKCSDSLIRWGIKIDLNEDFINARKQLIEEGLDSDDISICMRVLKNEGTLSFKDLNGGDNGVDFTYSADLILNRLGMCPVNSVWSIANEMLEPCSAYDAEIILKTIFYGEYAKI